MQSEGKQLLKLEKKIKDIINKKLKDRTLEYALQIAVSSMEPKKLRYSAMISSPAKGVQDITFVLNSIEELDKALDEFMTKTDHRDVEKAYHENRINVYKSRIAAHEGRIKELEEGKEE